MATLPDPLDSHFSFAFDSMMEAIQEAVAASDFLLDRFYLPWEDVRRKRLGARESEAPRIFETVPGAVLFRHTDSFVPGRESNWRLLMVFLVGETPTAGIHKAALQEALRTIQAWGPAQGRQVRIMGPVFSGSAVSLRTVMENIWERGDAKFRIVSGTAMAPKSKEMLDRGEGGQSKHSTFHATVIPTDFVTRKLYEYFRDKLRAQPEEMAALIEANTAFGRSLSPKEPQEREKEKEDVSLPPPPRWILPYPMNLARVRTEYERNPVLVDPLSSVGPVVPQRGLDISLEEPEYARDAIPAQSLRITPASDDLMLSTILSDISRKRMRYVGLLGSDPMDKIFLARQISSYCPDVRLFTVGGFLFFAHPKIAPVLEGMIVAHTYPLFSESQLWTVPGPPARLYNFPDIVAAGTYNATLLLLNYDEGGTLNKAVRADVNANSSYGLPDAIWPNSESAPPLVDYAAPGRKPGEEAAPVVWLTAVGRGGFWPLKFYTIDAECDKDAVRAAKSYLHPYAPEATKPDKTHGYDKRPAIDLRMVLLVFATVFTLATAWRCIRVWSPRQTAAGQQAPPAAPFAVIGGVRQFFEGFGPSSHAALRWHQAFWVLMYFAVSLAAYSLLLVLSLVGMMTKWPLGLDWASAFVTLGICVITVIFLLGATTQVVGQLSARSQWLPALVWLLIANGATWVLVLFAPQSDTTPLLYFRAINLRSGISPVLPLAFLGGGLICVSVGQLKRLWLLDKRPRSAFAQRAGLGSAGVAMLERQLWRALIRPFVAVQRAWLAGLFGLFVFLPMLAVWSRYIPSFEGWWFDYLFLGLLALLYCWVFFAFLRFLVAWHYFRKLLRRLAWHPMNEAYGRLPEQVRRTLGGQFSGRLTTVTELEHLVERWRELCNAWSPPVLSQKGLAPQMVRSCWEKETADKRRIVFWRSKTWGLLRKASYQVLAVLEALWSRRSPLPSAKNEDRDAWIAKAEEFVAMQVVLFVRRVFLPLRSLLTLTTAGLLFMLMAIASYPFEPRRFLMLVLWSFLLAFVVLAITAFVQMNRDHVLSRIAGTPVDRLTLDVTFVKAVLTYGVLPILALLAAQFPDIGSFLFSWLDTTAKVFK
ncbi:MAG: hypothetical protein HY000_41350 [Planctomycetes bacterium]|nr:hypothetical protein [Planctomycetota bacterium]